MTAGVDMVGIRVKADAVVGWACYHAVNLYNQIFLFCIYRSFHQHNPIFISNYIFAIYVLLTTFMFPIV